ncbi:MAG: hypothetical protein ABIG63_13565 [Chloroflexota bacterium]
MPLLRKKASRVQNKGLVVLPFILIILTACLPAPPVTLLPTETPAPTRTPTPTVVWFPVTDTPASPPTVIPSLTPETRPGVGDILLTDDFSTSEHWLVGEMPKGSVALGVDELTLALIQPKGYIFSFRDQPTFDDFYLEITASPNLCTGLDEYGLLLRYNSPSDFYRFSLSCNGQTRLDRIVGGGAASPQPWMPSTSVPSAAPSSSRLGVWVVGQEMHFFINDEFQFAISDRMLARGMIGVFARSAGEMAVTVSFSDLVVRAIQP